ncbi:MAG: biotin--[acetyl-CoA-carboxylase] ligase [Firmicutes bacterium]|nr:biotin--[acetyl-CoA-carboxylase] ligase [Bacillota bacterium]
MTDYALIQLESVDSTNNYAKCLDVSDGPIVVVSDTQTAGRGRLGRSFYSPPESGLYMSIALPSESIFIPPALITLATAVAVRQSIEQVFGSSPEIKWVNDLFLRDRKICGILTERTAEKTVIGIGVNCYPSSLPPEIKDIAGSIIADRAIGQSIDPRTFSDDACDVNLTRDKKCDLRDCIAINVLSLLTEKRFGDKRDFDYLGEYRRHCFIIGHEVKVTNFANENGSPSSFLARAIDIADNGGLVIEPLDGSPTLTLISGEVSVNLY